MVRRGRFGALLDSPLNVTTAMLLTIAAILLVLWVLGIIGTYTIGWFIHLLLIVAVILVLIRVIRGENPLY